jgi:hypothetical protein
MELNKYKHTQSVKQSSSKVSTLRQQNNQDYIANKFEELEESPEIMPINVRDHEDNDDIDKIELDCELESPMALPVPMPYVSKNMKSVEQSTPANDHSDEQVNYGRAFEEIKRNMQRHNYISPEHHKDSLNSNSYEHIYDDYLDKDLHSNLENDQSEGELDDEGLNNNFETVDSDTNDLRNEMADEYRSNEVISFPKPIIISKREVNNVN